MNTRDPRDLHDPTLRAILEELRRELLLDRQQILHELRELRRLVRDLLHNQPQQLTPTFVTFKEITMLAPDPGNTLVFTGTIAPAGAAFPTGTTFSAASVDPDVKVAVDPTGLIVTVAISTSAVPGTDATITWKSSTFTPEPTTSPSEVTATIPLTIGAPPPPPTPTPTAVSFVQTT